MSFLKIEGLTKSFGKTEVLKNLSFEAEKGEILSVTGSSGNGKTTLLRCLNFLEIAEKGKFFLDGKLIWSAIESNEKKIEDAKKNFGLVFQSYNLFPQYTAFKNIYLPLKLAEKSRKKKGLPSLSPDKDLHDLVFDLLEKFDIKEKANSYPRELSGGQKQRIAIARALALKPSVLCLDEPTSALDPSLTADVAEILKSLKKEGITMIVVTHDLSFAERVSDKISVISNGVIFDKD
ncbi:MAG: amino acid ABC transporter ATP-binding protein [Clostridia bacterium]|nr:amino acid ABC transporter ATP-binding protein [Clostridia bacterium]